MQRLTEIAQKVGPAFRLVYTLIHARLWTVSPILCLWDVCRLSLRLRYDLYALPVILGSRSYEAVIFLTSWLEVSLKFKNYYRMCIKNYINPTFEQLIPIWASGLKPVIFKPTFNQIYQIHLRVSLKRTPAAIANSNTLITVPEEDSPEFANVSPCFCTLCLPPTVSWTKGWRGGTVTAVNSASLSSP